MTMTMMQRSNDSMSTTTRRWPGRRGALLIACTMLPLGGASAAATLEFPTRPMRIIVPFAPGGPTDVAARVIGPKMTEAWGQPVIIDNRSGAGGNLGMALAAKAPPDGHTVLFTSSSVVVNQTLFSKPGELQARINRIMGDPISQQVTAYVSVFGGAFLRFLYLLLLGFLGSMIASRGIQFFMASESVIDEAVAGSLEE